MVSRLRKFLGMIVAVAAMLLLAPVMASAHEGHHEGPGVAAAAHHAAEIAHHPVEAVVSAPAGLDLLCSSNCCAGMACCFVALAAGAPALAPPAFFGTETCARAPPRLAGVRPPGIPEPPKALT